MAGPIDYDRIAAEYARNRQVHPEVLRNLLLNGRVDAESRVVEVGCGTGNYILTLETLTHCACWGVDPSEQMLARARERSQSVHFQTGRAEALGLPAAYFDLLFSVDVIHHVTGRAEYFRQAYEALKAGGRMCTVTDSTWIIRHRQPLAVYFPETVEVDLARYPRIEDLKTHMLQAGFAELGESTAELRYELTDSRAYRDRAFSVLHLVSDQAFERGLVRLEEDLRRGPIPGIARYVLLWGAR